MTAPVRVGVGGRDSLARWRDVLACPACRSAMPDLEHCDVCGQVFSAEEGLPRLIPAGFSRPVQFTFESSRATAGAHELLEKLSMPQPSNRRNLPYHLDPCHAKVIEQISAATTEALCVLEIGCGGGQLRRWFQQEGWVYLGVDISPTRVPDWLQRYGGPDLLCDAHFLPFLDEQCDLVYSAAVMEHLACPHLAVQEAMRILKPHGWYMGSVSFLEPWHDNSFFHMSPLGVLEVMRQAGLDVVHVWPGGGWSAFHALGAMGFGRLFRLLQYPLRLGYRAYRLEEAVLRLGRRALRREPKLDILHQAKVAGAMNWIARRPS